MITLNTLLKFKNNIKKSNFNSKLKTETEAWEALSNEAWQKIKN